MRNFLKIAITVIAIAALALAIGLGVRAITNKSWFDATYSFERAMIAMPNGDIIEGRVSSWTDFNDGDQIQLKIGGKTYLTHISNVTLISE